MGISKNINNLRKKEGLTQKEFADKIGVSSTAVARWEKGTSKVSEDIIKKINETFKCDINNYEKKVVKEEKKSFNLNKNDSKNLKIISKMIYIIARVIKVLLIIAVPFVVFAMILIPIVASKVEINENALTIEMLDGEKVIIESDIKLDGSYAIRYKDDIATDEIKFDLLGQVIKSIGNMSKTKIVVYFETILTISIAGIIIEIMIFNYLEKLFRNIYDKTPFIEENVTYLNNIVNYLIANILISILMSFILNNFAKINVSNNINLIYLIIMLAVGATSYIIKYGINLQKNTDSDIY